MLPLDMGMAAINIIDVSEGGVRELLLNHPKGIESAVGHADTAALFSDILSLNIPCERRTITLSANDTILVGQYNGPRLPEGATTLPEGASIRWLHVTVTNTLSPECE
jgi:hypothetical protein